MFCVYGKCFLTTAWFLSVFHSFSTLVQLIIRNFLFFLKKMLYTKSMVIINCIITHSSLYSKLNWFFFFHLWMWYICSCLSTCYVDRLITSKPLFSQRVSVCSVILMEVFRFAKGAAQGGAKGASPIFIEQRQPHLESVLESTLFFGWWNGAPEIVPPSHQVTAHG